MNKVYFEYQYDSNACGAAVLCMAYSSLGMKSVSQEDIYKKYSVLEPHGTGNFRINSVDLVCDSREKGFLSEMYQVTEFTKNSTLIMKELLKANFILIVCQQYTKEEPLIGHFRIVTDIDEDAGVLTVNDPDPEFGGENIKMSADDFYSLWEETGQNVIGGILIIVNQKNVVIPNSLKLFRHIEV